MSKEEIRKLLGGYATNTLSESERNALFEAALDDQELFDALQQEQALKNVLADPVARAEIRQALGQPRASRPPWWIWSGAIGAVAATVILAFVFWPHTNPVLQKQVQIAAVERQASPASPTAPLDALKELPQPSPPARDQRRPGAPRNKALNQKASAPAEAAQAAPQANAQAAAQAAPVPAPPPRIPAPVLAQTPSPLQQQGAGTATLFQRGQAADQLAASGTAGNRLAPSSIVYSLVKQDAAGKDSAPIAGSDLKRGDLVRVRVRAEVPGRILLSRFNPTGEWQRIESVSAQPDSNYFLPNDPIAVTGDVQKFRLTFEPGVPEAKKAQSFGQLAQPLPVPVEITIVAVR